MWHIAWQKTQNDGQGKGVHDCCKTGNDVRGWGMGSEESSGEEIGRGSREDVEMDVLCYKAGQNKEWKDQRATKVGEISNNVQQRRLYGCVMRNDEGGNSDEDGCLNGGEGMEDRSGRRWTVLMWTWEREETVVRADV